MKIETALLSVSDKTGIVELGQRLQGLGIEILSTGGTARALSEAGVKTTSVSDRTGFPEILNGRVKTLHPAIHGGILARLQDAGHKKELARHGISPIGLVAVNLYPFSKTVERSGVSLEEAVEQIDIGGPTLIRAAAKNCSDVTVLTDPCDYVEVAAEIEVNRGQTSLKTRQRLALKAFRQTAAYDLAIGAYLENQQEDRDHLPAALAWALTRVKELRYGENPHQRAALYRPRFVEAGGLAAAAQHQGKELSFNNYVDLEAARNLCREFSEPFCAVVKHTNPCGAAVADMPAQAFERALACDPISAFGSVVGFNRAVDGETARAMKSLFVEAVIAPGYDDEALGIFRSKKNMRVIEIGWEQPEEELECRNVSGGLLVQSRDFFSIGARDLKTATRRAPTKNELQDLLFAWKVCKHVKSNAIVLAREGRTLGVGAGQMSRVDSVNLAAAKANQPLQGAVMASDAFFPFRDGVDGAAAKGVRAVIQPGGSIRDAEVIEAADEHLMAMVLTGIRHFKH